MRQVVHDGPCPRVKLVRYRPDGTIKSVEFNSPIATRRDMRINDQVLHELEDAIKDYGEAGWWRQRVRYLAARVRIENALATLSNDEKDETTPLIQNEQSFQDQAHHSLADFVIDHIRAATESLAIKVELDSPPFDSVTTQALARILSQLRELDMSLRTQQAHVKRPK